ncbi:NAD-binding protein [Kribbella capetownensis]|uniref:NAD-binding protein n=1 Tax=Kribbella capetownensis TaxID=1572659 RepID=UPI00192D771D|nr:NAD-binding protein [Kribbella capetownensis]
MTPHIVVLGAGYSGMIAAKLAARRTGAPVTLVNARDTFVERVRMHQLARRRCAGGVGRRFGSAAGRQ